MNSAENPRTGTRSHAPRFGFEKNQGLRPLHFRTLNHRHLNGLGKGGGRSENPGHAIGIRFRRFARYGLHAADSRMGGSVRSGRRLRRFVQTSFRRRAFGRFAGSEKTLTRARSGTSVFPFGTRTPNLRFPADKITRNILRFRQDGELPPGAKSGTMVGQFSFPAEIRQSR